MRTIGLALVATAVLLAALHTVAAQELTPAAPIANQKSDVPADVEITLAPTWKVGDRYRIEQVSEQQEIRRGQRLPERSSRTLSAIEVIEATNSAYVIAATLVESDLSQAVGGQPGGVDTAALLTELFQGKTMEFVTNEDGIPVGLRNKQEMVELMRAAMDGMMASMVPDPQQREQVQATMNQMMTPDVIEAMAIKDAVTFYGLMGGIYQGGPAQAYDLPMQFPFSQETVDAELHVLLRRIDDGAGTVHISTQSVPNAEDLKRATENWFKSIVEAQGQSLPPDFRFPEFAMRDTVDYVIDRNRMLPTEVAWERYVRMGNDMLRVSRSVFRLKPAD